jgi:hypothetical protein
MWTADVDVVWLVPLPGGMAAAESLRHGPYRVSAGRASGFSHDVIGAAIAASNLAARVTAGAPEVYEATLREQCYGDIPAALAQLHALLESKRGLFGAGVEGLSFRVLAGDPDCDEVTAPGPRPTAARDRAAWDGSQRAPTRR